MGKLIALWRVFRKGEAVANPAAWKAGQITVTTLYGLLLAAVRAAQAFGVEVSADETQLTHVAGGAVALANILLTVATSKSVGLPAVDAAAPGGAGAGAGEDLEDLY